MSAPKNFVTGFNHNVQHKGQVFHVQTEDSGAEFGHIITHLFRGGDIIASKKTSYSEMLGAPALRDLVRALMEEQHKEMLRNLVSGVYDGAEKEPEQGPPPPQASPEPQPPPPPQASQGVASWPWSGKGRPHTPPPFPAPKLPQEPTSWPAGGGKAMPPPLPFARRPSGAGGDRSAPPPPILSREPPLRARAPTLLSEDLVSDRSLDEVILRYLSGEREEE